MLEFEDIVKLQSLYNNGDNVMQYIKSNLKMNSENAILFSYDLQAGSYIRALSDNNFATLKKQVGSKLADIVKHLNIQCICEAGVGEATTFGHVLSSLNIKTKYAFDISMSRLFYAQRFLKSLEQNVNLFSAELLHIPFADNAIECIYTFHSIEPNGGKEKELLAELLRVTGRYLILIEPDYDMFSAEQKQRMDAHGYCKSLHQTLLDLNADVISYEPWELDGNPLNKASIIIVEKTAGMQTTNNSLQFVSPLSHMPLKQVKEGFFCVEDGFLFPIINNIPVFLKQNAILASHYNHFFNE